MDTLAGLIGEFQGKPLGIEDKVFYSLQINTVLCRGVQPVACGLLMAQNGYERGPTQNCKFT